MPKLNDTVLVSFFISVWIYNFKCCTFLMLAVDFITIFFLLVLLFFSFVVSNLFTLLCDVKFPELCVLCLLSTLTTEHQLNPHKTKSHRILCNTIENHMQGTQQHKGFHIGIQRNFKEKMRNKKKNRVREGE